MSDDTNDKQTDDKPKRPTPEQRRRWRREPDRFPHMKRERLQWRFVFHDDLPVG